MDEILLNFYILKSKCTIKTRKALSGIETGKQYQRMEETRGRRMSAISRHNAKKKDKGSAKVAQG